MTNILIYGASGHAKMIVDIIHKNRNYNIVGFLDTYKTPGENVYGYYVLGGMDALNTIIKEFNVKAIVIGIGNNFLRKQAFEKIKNSCPNINFASIIHPSAIIANDVEIPMGSVLMAGSIVNADAQVGRFCLINTKASLGHDSIMKDFSSLAPAVTTGGNVEIGYCSAICISATLVNNVKIGNHSVVGASSLVLNDIGNLKLALGSPIESITDREKDHNYFSE